MKIKEALKKAMPKFLSLVLDIAKIIIIELLK